MKFTPGPHTFTYEYSQPTEYHFCQDSVVFPKFVAHYLKDRPVTDDYRVLDVCAGCGVIGFELAHHDRRLKKVDFLEIQEAFRSHFAANLEITGQSPAHFRFIHGNYADLKNEQFANQYDLIVGNPPYFFLGEGLLSPSEFQNRCRFFIDSDLRTLFEGVLNALKPATGTAFLLVKSGEKHGRRSLRDLTLWLAGRGTVEKATEIRGTTVIKVTKPI